MDTGITVHTGLENLRTYNIQTIPGIQYIRNKKFLRVWYTKNQELTAQSTKSVPQSYQLTLQNIDTREENHKD